MGDVIGDETRSKTSVFIRRECARRST